ncbi:signal peptidase II [Homoserinimonas aerilata]|uniref:Lipoprotein signal peptidase n=1 Tax=Homoserinimonas aerilata TaxID=1162970 RepID=A0A542YH56_9MICO|nr:signal peptidase II [Homoserinimonas aerilata]TQL47422.1 signal peptidase II [Homoserinimonas aerilata]
MPLESTRRFLGRWSSAGSQMSAHGMSRSGGRRRRFAIASLVAVAIALIDQATKAAALMYLSENERIPLLGDLLGLQLAFNPGTVMSLGSNTTWVFTLLGILASIALFVAAARAPSTPWAVAIGFVWGGAVGNLTDRLLAAPGFGRGHVTDFLAYANLFIGNLADIALGVGVGLGILLSMRSEQPQQRAEVSERSAE